MEKQQTLIEKLKELSKKQNKETIEKLKALKTQGNIFNKLLKKK